MPPLKDKDWSPHQSLSEIRQNAVARPPWHATHCGRQEHFPAIKDGQFADLEYFTASQGVDQGAIRGRRVGFFFHKAAPHPILMEEGLGGCNRRHPQPPLVTARHLFRSHFEAVARSTTQEAQRLRKASITWLGIALCRCRYRTKAGRSARPSRRPLHPSHYAGQGTDAASASGAPS